MWFHRESSLFLFFYFLFSLLTTVSIYIEVNLSLKRVNNVNSESKENWNISIQRSLRMVHGSRVEDIKIVERVKVSLYVTIRDTFHACECICVNQRGRVVILVRILSQWKRLDLTRSYRIL